MRLLRRNPKHDGAEERPQNLTPHSKTPNINFNDALRDATPPRSCLASFSFLPRLFPAPRSSLAPSSLLPRSSLAPPSLLLRSSLIPPSLLAPPSLHPCSSLAPPLLLPRSSLAPRSFLPRSSLAPRSRDLLRRKSPAESQGHRQNLTPHPPKPKP